MSGRRKRGKKHYITFKVKVPNPKFDPTQPPHWEKNPPHLWKSQAAPVSESLETFTEFKKDFDYDSERRGLHLPNRRLSWPEFIVRLKREFAPGKKSRAWNRDLTAIHAYERLIKPIKITDATPDSFSLFKVQRLAETSRRGRPVAPGTVNTDLGSLSAIMTKAVQWGYLRDHPLRFIEKYRIPKQSRRALTREETARAIAASKKSESKDAYDMMMFFLLTGVRLEELTHLPWAHVDVVAGTYKIEAWDSGRMKDWPRGWREVRWSPKNCQIRENPLDPQLLPIIRHRWKRRETPLVFPGLRGPRGRFRLGELFDRIFKRGGVEGVTIHNLRHTYGTRMAESGCDTGTLQDFLGHADVNTTMLYFTAEMIHKLKRQKKLSLT